MNRPPRRDVELQDPKRKLSAWERDQQLIAAGPSQLPDGRWLGCRHYVPPPPATDQRANKSGERAFAACPHYGICPDHGEHGPSVVGPGLHDHIKKETM